MKLYVQYDSASSLGVLDTEQDTSNTLNYLGWGQERSFIFPSQNDLILSKGSVDINLSFLSTEPYKTSLHVSVYNLTITPYLFIRDPGLNDNLIWSGLPYVTSSKAIDNPKWRTNLENYQDLANQNLILNLKIGLNKSSTDPSPTDPGGITVQTNSFIDSPLIGGEKQAIDFYSTANFTKFQVRERIFLYETINLKERIVYHSNYVLQQCLNNSLPVPQHSLLTTIKNHENIVYKMFTNIKLKETNSLDLYSTTQQILDSNAYITDIDLGGLVYPSKLSNTYSYDDFDKYSLREKVNVKSAVNNLRETPDLVLPDYTPKFDEKNSFYSGMANDFVFAAEMLKTQVDGPDTTRHSPDYSLVSWASDLFVPSNLIKTSSKGNWNLPGNHSGNTISTYFQTSVKKNDIENLHQVDVLLFLLRYVPDGTFISASHNGDLGEVVLENYITSTDKQIVWMWKNVYATDVYEGINVFRVQLDLKSNSSLNPAFQGKAAAILAT